MKLFHEFLSQKNVIILVYGTCKACNLVTVIYRESWSMNGASIYWFLLIDTSFCRMAEKRREAEAATNLMSVTFTRIRSEEESRRGLVITSAIYGRLASLSTSTNPFNDQEGMRENMTEDVIDVTIPLQCLVKDSKLIVYDSTKVGKLELYKNLVYKI